MVEANFWQSHSPSQLAWSEGWQPPGTHQMNRVNSTTCNDFGRDDSTINIVVVIIVVIVVVVIISKVSLH